MNTKRGEMTAEVHVSRPCDCAPCKRDDRWWKCERIEANHIHTYLCSPEDEAHPSIPHRDNIAAIRAMHPDAVLVYIA